MIKIDQDPNLITYSIEIEMETKDKNGSEDEYHESDIPSIISLIRNSTFKEISRVSSEIDHDTLLFIDMVFHEIENDYDDYDYIFEDDKEVNFSEMTPTELTYLYHIISTYKVKGLRDESHHFVNVLRRIGDMSKIIKYYDTYKEDLTSKLTNWAANMGGGELENELDPMGSELQSDPYTDGKEL